MTRFRSSSRNTARAIASFLLAHHILGNSRGEACGDLCRIMREYTNIRDTRTNTEVQLVANLSMTQRARPNIFVFVVDAMRPDYLGAYNPRVDYTPNLDAFARDSIVLHNAYSQYAGTSLSEPALWSGAMMLHAHYLKPFSKVNGLEQMLRADNYHMVVSMDEVLKEVLLPDDRLTKLDTDKQLWNQLEIGSTRAAGGSGTRPSQRLARARLLLRSAQERAPVCPQRCAFADFAALAGAGWNEHPHQLRSSLGRQMPGRVFQLSQAARNV